MRYAPRVRYLPETNNVLRQLFTINRRQFHHRDRPRYRSRPKSKPPSSGCAPTVQPMFTKVSASNLGIPPKTLCYSSIQMYSLHTARSRASLTQSPRAARCRIRGKTVIQNKFFWRQIVRELVGEDSTPVTSIPCTLPSYGIFNAT